MKDSVTKDQCATGDHVYQWNQDKTGFTPCVFCGHTPKPLEELARERRRRRIKLRATVSPGAIVCRRTLLGDES